MIEHQVSLQDSLIQILTEPEELRMLNMDRLSVLDIPLGVESDAYLTHLFVLGEEIKVETRVVTSLVSLFGDIGGLREVFSSLILLLVGSFQSKAYLFD